MAKKDEPERVLGTGATGDVDHPEKTQGYEGTPADGVPVDERDHVPDRVETDTPVDDKEK